MTSQQAVKIPVEIYKHKQTANIVIRYGSHFPLLRRSQKNWSPLFRSHNSTVLPRCGTPTSYPLLSRVSDLHGATILRLHKVQRWLLLVLSWRSAPPLCQSKKRPLQPQHYLYQLPPPTLDLRQRYQRCWCSQDPGYERENSAILLQSYSTVYGGGPSGERSNQEDIITKVKIVSLKIILLICIDLPSLRHGLLQLMTPTLKNLQEKHSLPRSYTDLFCSYSNTHSFKWLCDIPIDTLII